MFHPQKMVKIQLTFPKQLLEKVTSALYDLKLLHVLDHARTDELDIGKPMDKAEKLSEILIKIRSIISHLGITEGEKSNKSAKPLQDSGYFQLGKQSKELYLTVLALLERKKEITEKLVGLQKQSEFWKAIHSLQLPLSYLKDTQNLTCFVGTTQKPNIKAALKQVTDRFELVEGLGDPLPIAIFVQSSFADKMQSALQQFHFQSFDRNIITDAKSNPSKQYQSAENGQDKLKSEIHEIDARLKKLAAKHEEFLLLNEHLLAEEIKKAEIPLRFGSSSSVIVAEGYVPEKECDVLEDRLIAATNNKLLIQKFPLSKNDAVPIKLENPKPVKPFQFFLEMYSLPSYKELDPSILFFFTFPIFFGIMLGDVGYGIIVFMIFWLLKKKIPAAKDFFRILMFAAAVTIIFGFVFGEYFGFEGISEETGDSLCETGICFHKTEIERHGEVETRYEFPHLLNRFHSVWDVAGFSVPAILVIGAIIGFIHLNLGFLIGFWNVYRAHGVIHAFEEKLSWIIIELAIFLLISPYLGFEPSLWYWGIALLLIGFIALAKGEGIQGFVELPALLSNTLSYMRLGAVGLASVGLAVVVNEQFAMPQIEHGGIGIFIGIFLMVLGHAVNIALGIIGPFLHSLRLHYVEFFSKFYKGGGIRYEPFGNQDENE